MNNIHVIRVYIVLLINKKLVFIDFKNPDKKA